MNRINKNRIHDTIQQKATKVHEGNILTPTSIIIHILYEHLRNRGQYDHGNKILKN